MICKVCASPVSYRFSIDFRRENRQHMVHATDLPLPDVWDYFECTWCHALQTAAMDQLTPDEMARFYTYEASYSEQSLNRAQRAVRFVEWATKRFPPEGNQLLCYGAGVSPEPDFFRQRLWNVDTCDFGEGYTFKPTAFPYVAAYYDIISSMEVLEHLQYPVLTLGQILDHLAPGGTFVASTGLWSRLPQGKRNAEWWYVQHSTEGHIFIWTLQALDIVAQQHGCYVMVIGKERPLCAGMGGSGQYPVFIHKPLVESS